MDSNQLEVLVGETTQYLMGHHWARQKHKRGDAWKIKEQVRHMPQKERVSMVSIPQL